MKSWIFTIIIALVALFAWQADKAKWQRVYLENRLDYCRQLVAVLKTGNAHNSEEALKMWEYGCTRQK